MGLPGHRRTSSDKRRRAAHFALIKTKLSKCGKCGEEVLSHHACRTCGTYAGRQVLRVKTVFDKKKKPATKSTKPSEEKQKPESKKE